jgi:hypothetical protein
LVLLALVPAVGVALAAPAPPSTPNPKERAAAAALKKAGFELTVAKDDPRLRVITAIWSPADRAAVLTAADLARLRELPHLENLAVLSAEEDFVLDNEAAGQLERVRGLKILMTSGVEFRPGTLARVAGGPRGLTVLYLDYCRFAGEELDAVGKLPKLRTFGLTGTGVTDSDLGRLWRAGAFPKLDTVELSGCEKVTAGGVAALRKARPKLDIYGGPKPAAGGAPK